MSMTAAESILFHKLLERVEDLEKRLAGFTALTVLRRIEAIQESIKETEHLAYQAASQVNGFLAGMPQGREPMPQVPVPQVAVDYGLAEPAPKRRGRPPKDRSLEGSEEEIQP